MNTERPSVECVISGGARSPGAIYGVVKVQRSNGAVYKYRLVNNKEYSERIDSRLFRFRASGLSMLIFSALVAPGISVGAISAAWLSLLAVPAFLTVIHIPYKEDQNIILVPNTDVAQRVFIRADRIGSDMRSSRYPSDMPIDDLVTYMIQGNWTAAVPEPAPERQPKPSLLVTDSLRQMKRTDDVALVNNVMAQVSTFDAATQVHIASACQAIVDATDAYLKIEESHRTQTSTDDVTLVMDNACGYLRRVLDDSVSTAATSQADKLSELALYSQQWKAPDTTLEL